MFPGASLRLFRVFGISIEINISWVVIFALVTYSLSALLLPTQYPGLSPGTYFAIGSVTAVLFFASILIHELAHSVVALRNDLPIKAITLFIFGGVSQMSEEPKTPGVELKVAIAGPLSSIALALVFAALAIAASAVGSTQALAGAAGYLALVNLILAVFNMIPGFPLDGGRVFRAILWYFTGSLVRSTIIAARSGQVVAFILAFLGFVSIASGNLANGIWIILIAWFLEQAASSGAQTAKAEERLSHVKVENVMTLSPATVSANTTLAELVDDHLSRYRHGHFPITEKEEIIGVITMDELRKVPRSTWTNATVREAMQPMSDGMIVEPSMPAVSAMRRMAAESITHLLVFSESKLVGILTRGDVIRMLNSEEGF